VVYEPISRDLLFTSPTFDFYFNVVLPKARKAREIVQRDCLGRIVASKALELQIPYAQK